MTQKKPFIHNFPSKRILFIFPPVAARLRALDSLLSGGNPPERYLYYGLDYFRRNGLSATHNVFHPTLFASRLDRIWHGLARLWNAYPGDLAWLIPVWRKFFCCNAMLVFSDRAVFPVIYLRLLRILPRCPVLYISVGLPEKLNAFGSARLKRIVVDEFTKLGRVVSLSKIESDCLASRHGFGDAAIFLPAGVDVHYFSPQLAEITIDVLSIGADPFRDFVTLFEAARLLPSLNFLIVTSKAHADTFQRVPANVSLKIDVPMAEMRGILGSCRIVALPVRDNTYSGGTTVMLQAMAMGKVVVANRIGANVSGYGFNHRSNCLFVSPGNGRELAYVLKNTLLDQDLLDTIGKAARHHVTSNLTLEQFHEKLFGIMNEILATKQGVS